MKKLSKKEVVKANLEVLANNIETLKQTLRSEGKNLENIYLMAIGFSRTAKVLLDLKSINELNADDLKFEIETGQCTDLCAAFDELSKVLKNRLPEVLRARDASSASLVIVLYTDGCINTCRGEILPREDPMKTCEVAKARIYETLSDLKNYLADNGVDLHIRAIIGVLYGDPAICVDDCEEGICPTRISCLVSNVNEDSITSSSKLKALCSGAAILVKESYLGSKEACFGRIDPTDPEAPYALFRVIYLMTTTRIGRIEVGPRIVALVIDVSGSMAREDIVMGEQ